MATNYGEKERTWIGGLEADTGRDLELWLAAIRDAAPGDRNQTIDWLRMQGFTFAKASWLERIHHNGGRLIYADPALVTTAGPDLPAAVPAAISKQLDVQTQRPLAASRHPATVMAGASAAEIGRLLDKAKGLRPLADLILRETERLFPATTYEIMAESLVFCAPQPFAALVPAPKELRLFGDFGDAKEAPVRPADKMPRSHSAFSGVVSLTDARAVNPAFRTMLTSAHARAHAVLPENH